MRRGGERKAAICVECVERRGLQATNSITNRRVGMLYKTSSTWMVFWGDCCVVPSMECRRDADFSYGRGGKLRIFGGGGRLLLWENLLSVQKWLWRV